MEKSGNILTSRDIASSVELNELLPWETFHDWPCAMCRSHGNVRFFSTNGRYFLEIVSSEEKDIT